MSISFTEPRRWGEPTGAWRALTACVLTIALAAGSRFSLAAFFRPIEADTGLDRLTLSVAAAIAALAYGLTLPTMGRLATRYGPRRVLMAGVMLMAVGGFGVVTATRAWQFFLFLGLLPGVGFGAATHVPGTVLLASWFDRRLGLATGIMSSAIPAGQSVFVPLAAALIPALGWRATYILLGMTLAAGALPALWWLAREPVMEGHRETTVTEAPRQRVGIDVWLVAAGFFACGFTDQFVAFHLVALASEAGVNPLVAAGFLSFALVAGIAGSVASGPVADRWRAGWILAGLYLSRAAVLPLLLLVGAGRLWVMAAFGLLFGLTYIANQAPGTRLVRDRYGLRAVGRLMGGLGMAHQIGGMAGIAMGGVSVRVWGGYAVAVTVAAGVALAGCLLQLLIGPPTTSGAAVRDRAEAPSAR